MSAPYRSPLRIPSDAEWTQSRVARLPIKWQRSLIDRWIKLHTKNYQKANIELREATKTFLDGGIPLAASDDDVCAFGEKAAKHCADLFRLLHEPCALRNAMESYCKRHEISPPPQKVKNGPALARMTCPLWWRRKLRRHHSCALESAAIRLGLVSKSGDLYVSQECLEMRRHQNHRNRSMLEATIATNELGQSYSLAELASLSVSKKSNRRAELMTRIRGFDAIAQKNDHAGLFVTITCPSRFHRFKLIKKGTLAVNNNKYDPELTPASGQKYLARLWARIRAKLHREDIRLYGFRVSEPMHDGTPHWHMLLFCERDHATKVAHALRHYSLQDTPDEVGAQEHRCQIKHIDRNKGSAAGYISKYISKNINGEYVGNDFHDRAATESAQRVEAWATTWAIRQFQQIGGPPVSVWRELRRIPDIPMGAPNALKLAHDAANKQLRDESTSELRVFWDKYCDAQGGVFSGRDARIQLLLISALRHGRYGEELCSRPSGVRVVDSTEWVVHSRRHTWTISRSSRPRNELTSSMTQSCSSWTRVNNCTRHTTMNASHSSEHLPIKRSTTSMNGLLPEHSKATLLSRGGTCFETVSQPPNPGTDVQEVALVAGANDRTSLDVSSM